VRRQEVLEEDVLTEEGREEDPVTLVVATMTTAATPRVQQLVAPVALTVMDLEVTHGHPEKRTTG